MSSKFKIRFFAVFSIILLCIGSTVKGLQNDTFYIIKLGGDILKNGVDLVDHYCWITKLPYTYPHWLYDVFINVIYSNFSYVGVYISTIILFIILILSIYIINLKVNKNELLAVIISIVTLGDLIGFATARAQLVTSILFVWQVYFIEMLISSGKKRYIFLLAFISLLVANLHATIWPFYFILFLPFIGQHFLYLLIRKTKSSNLKKNVIVLADKLVVTKINNFKSLVISMLLGFFMGFLSPSKICFTYVFKIMQGDSQQFIVEHAPLVLVKNWPLLLSLVALLILLIFTKLKVKVKDVLMICGILFMSLCSFRHVAFFYTIGLFYISIYFNDYLKLNNDKTLDILCNLFINKKCIYFLAVILVVIGSLYSFQKNFSKDYVSKKSYPVEAVNYIKNNLDVDNLRLYNDYGVGAYLLFNDIPVFIDSRCDLYLSEFNGLDYSIFDDAMNIAYNYEKKFKFYNVSHVLVKKKDILYKILIKDNNYNLIYSDKNFVLFERV